MVTSEKQYLDLLREILDHGAVKKDRTGVGTKSLFGRQMRFDLSKGFPLLTTKKVFLKGVIYELLWFLQGNSNIKYLVDHDIHIWNDWPYRYYISEIKKKKKPVLTQFEFIEKIKSSNAFAQKWGELGPVYGRQWRHWKTPNGGEIDQISQLVERIKTKPYDRRLIVSAWNVADIEEMAKAGLPPCHCLFQFYVVNGKLSCQLYQRSADFFLGVPFNIASYSLLTMMIAQVCDLEVGDFVHTFGDVHLYLNHLEQAKRQLSRDMRNLPTMSINKKVRDIFSFTYEDFTLDHYDPHPGIKAPIAV